MFRVPALQKPVTIRLLIIGYHVEIVAPGTTAFVLAYLGQELVVKILTTYATIVNNHHFFHFTHFITHQLVELTIIVIQISGCGPLV